MTIKVEAPTMGESITEATVASWVKKVGDVVAEDELIAELETDKINLEVTAPKAGTLTSILKAEGDVVLVGEVMAEIGEAGEVAAPVAGVAEASTEEMPMDEDMSAAMAMESAMMEESASVDDASDDDYDKPLSPAVKKMIEENAIDPTQIMGTGKDGR